MRIGNRNILFAVHHWYVHGFLCIISVLVKNMRPMGIYMMYLCRVPFWRKLASISKEINHRDKNRDNFLVIIVPSTGYNIMCHPKATWYADNCCCRCILIYKWSDLLSICFFRYNNSKPNTT